MLALQLGVRVLGVDVVAYPDEFGVVVGTGEEDDGYADQVGRGDAGWERSGGLRGGGGGLYVSKFVSLMANRIEPPRSSLPQSEAETSATVARRRETHLEFEAVDTDWDGSNHARVQLLVERVALRAADIRELPFEVYAGEDREYQLAKQVGREEGGTARRTVLERGHALEGDFEEVRVCELGGVVQDGDIAVWSTRFERAGEWENEGSCEAGTKTHVMLMMLIVSVAVSASPAVRVRARRSRVEMKKETRMDATRRRGEIWPSPFARLDNSLTMASVALKVSPIALAGSDYPRTDPRTAAARPLDDSLLLAPHPARHRTPRIPSSQQEDSQAQQQVSHSRPLSAQTRPHSQALSPAPPTPKPSAQRCVPSTRSRESPELTDRFLSTTALHLRLAARSRRPRPREVSPPRRGRIGPSRSDRRS